MKTKMTDTATGWRDVEAGLAADGLPPILTVAQTAKALNRCYTTVLKMIDAGEIPARIDRRGVSGRKARSVARATVAKMIANTNN